jgi:hypothetical protein
MYWLKNKKGVNMDSCLSCEKVFNIKEWFYIFYDEPFCTNCTTEEDKKLLVSNADNCFMTYSE